MEIVRKYLRGCMKVKFVGSFKKDFPKDERRHVGFAGRSNVGKSSLINTAGLLGSALGLIGPSVSPLKNNGATLLLGLYSIKRR